MSKALITYISISKRWETLRNPTQRLRKSGIEIEKKGSRGKNAHTILAENVDSCLGLFDKESASTTVRDMIVDTAMKVRAYAL